MSNDYPLTSYWHRGTMPFREDKLVLPYLNRCRSLTLSKILRKPQPRNNGRHGAAAGCHVLLPHCKGYLTCVPAGKEKVYSPCPVSMTTPDMCDAGTLQIPRYFLPNALPTTTARQGCHHTTFRLKVSVDSSKRRGMRLRLSLHPVP